MKKQTKKPYKKPTVHKVALRPDEAVLTGCKQAGTGKPQAPGRCEGACASVAGS
jgi:hypothetical protein